MPVQLLDNTGAQVIVHYDYHELTLDLMTSRKNAGYPLPDEVYKSYDRIFRALEAGSPQTLWIDITEDPENEGQPLTSYTETDLIGATIISAQYESSVIDERDEDQININTTTGAVDISIGGLMIDGKIKIIYKK